MIKKATIILEAVGLTILLVFSGGMKSPFFWFSIIIFILITFEFQYYNPLIRKFSRQAEKAKNELSHLKALIQVVEGFSYNNDPEEIAGLFASYGRTLTGAQKVIIWLRGDPAGRSSMSECSVVRGSRNVFPENLWLPYLRKFFEKKENFSGVFFWKVNDNPMGKLLTVGIKSNSKKFGVLSAYFTDHDLCRTEIEPVLSFLADLCAVALEKHLLEKNFQETILLEEKDRIAGEIHDGVTQNIFSMIYGIEALLKREGLDEDTEKQLRLLQKSARTSFQELRNFIYGLSSRNNKRNFLELIREYLSEMGKLNDILICFDDRGDFEHLSFPLQNTIYRFIREATGNAVRHAKCSSIEVSLKALPDKVKVSIKDNGCGFHLQKVGEKEKRGLGLDSMRELSRSKGGVFLLESNPGKGTRVSCEIPKYIYPVILTAEEEKINENCCY